MLMQLRPAVLSGKVSVPASKSMTHRFLIAAAFSCLQGGEGSVIRQVSFSEDIDATLRCLAALGADCTADRKAGIIRVAGGTPPAAEALFDCGESGSTLRFFIPTALQLCEQAVFTGKGRLLKRPQQPYEELFAEKGISFAADEREIRASGRLPAGEYALSGGISSQFITGLLFALSLCPEGESRIHITDSLQSKAYVDMTLSAMRAFGVQVENRDYRDFIIPGGQKYESRDLPVEGDYSQAAFFLTAEYLGSPVLTEGLSENSMQGDRAILPLLQELSVPGDREIDISEIPDLAPILAAAASFREGHTRIFGGERLRYKESDRIVSTVTSLAKLGIDIRELPDGMEITGCRLPCGKTVSCDSFNDHRIAMMLAVAVTACHPDTVLLLSGAEAVKKSYPDFWEVYRSLGGAAEYQTESEEKADAD